MKTSKKYNVAVMIIIEMIMVFFFSVTLNEVPPLITTISADTGWSLGKCGQLTSIVFFLCGAGSFVGSPIMDKFGTKKTALIALGLAVAGHVVGWLGGANYTLQYIGKFLYGCGWGIFFLVPGSVIAFWLPLEKRALFNGIRCTCDILGSGMAYYIILPIFHGLNDNWQGTFGVFGIVFAVIFCAYLFLLPTNEAELAEMAQKKDAKARGEKGSSAGIIKAAKSKQVWIILIALIGPQWIYNCFTTYVPSFLELERGYTAEAASNLTGIMSIAGMVAGVFIGSVSTIVGRRSVMTWPMILLMVIGGFGMAFTSSTALVIVFSIFIGFGLTGFMTAYTTIPGELPGADNDFYAGAVAIIYGIAFMLTYITPVLYQAILDSGRSQSIALAINTIPGIISLIAAFFIMETGPKGKYQQSLKANKQA